MANDNKSLGKFLLTGIPVAPRGVPQIEVSFEIDVNGILQVTAEDKGTGKQQNITISNTGGLGSTEVERMRQEAEKYAEQDSNRIKLIEIRNQADNLFYNYESTLSEQGKFIRQDLKVEIQKLKNSLEQAFANNNQSPDSIQEMVDQFRQKLLQVGSDVYQKATGQETGNLESMFDNFDETIAHVHMETEFEMPQEENEAVKALVTVQNQNRQIDSAPIDDYDDPTIIDEIDFEDYEVVD